MYISLKIVCSTFKILFSSFLYLIQEEFTTRIHEGEPEVEVEIENTENVKMQ